MKIKENKDGSTTFKTSTDTLRAVVSWDINGLFIQRADGVITVSFDDLCELSEIIDDIHERYHARMDGKERE